MHSIWVFHFCNNFWVIYIFSPPTGWQTFSRTDSGPHGIWDENDFKRLFLHESSVHWVGIQRSHWQARPDQTTAARHLQTAATVDWKTGDVYIYMCYCIWSLIWWRSHYISHMCHTCAAVSHVINIYGVIIWVYPALRRCVSCCVAVGVDAPVECNPTQCHPFKLDWQVKNPQQSLDSGSTTFYSRL